MRAALLLLTLLLSGCGGEKPPPPPPTTRLATLPGAPILATLRLETDAVTARYTAAAQGARPLRYELRCSSSTNPFTLSAEAESAVQVAGETEDLRFELLATDPYPLRCSLLAWAVRGYGPASEERVVETAPTPSPTPLPSGSPLPVATALFAPAVPLPAFDPIACSTPPAPPLLTAREPSTGTPLTVARAPGRFITARLRDATVLPTPDPIATVTPPLAAPSIRLRAGQPLELRVSGGGLAAATVELYDPSALVDGQLELDALLRRFSVTGPGSVNPVANPSELSGTIRISLDPSLSAGRYLLLVTGTAYSSCAAYAPERSLLLIEAAGGFSAPTPTPSPSILP